MDHAVLSASAAHRWLECPGSVALSRDIPRRSSRYAEEGTRAHEILEAILTGAAFECEDEEMLAHVVGVANEIIAVSAGGMVMAEQRVDYQEYLNTELTAFGTADALVVGDGELQVHDLKYGRGERVDVQENVQLMLYGLGALAALDDTLGPFEVVRLFIHQPRAGGTSEWAISADDLREWANAVARMAAAEVEYALKEEGPLLNPGEKQCRWCPAKASCPGLAREVLSTIMCRDTAAAIEEFDAVPTHLAKHVAAAGEDWLSAAMRKADLIEGWLTAVRAEVERRLVAGTPVEGFKLVRGRQGDRQWANPTEVEADLKKFRLKVEQMYDLKLINPTRAEKLAASEVIGPRQWAALQTKITRSEGKLHVAPEDDRRTAVNPSTNVVAELSTPSADADIA